MVSVPVSVTLFWYAASQHVDESGRYGSFSHCLLYVWCLVFGISVDVKPRSSPLHVLFTLWLLCSLPIKTVFRTYVTFFFTNAGLEHHVDNCEESGESEMEFAFEKFYNQNLSEETWKTLKPLFVFDGPHICLRTSYRTTDKQFIVIVCLTSLRPELTAAPETSLCMHSRRTRYEDIQQGCFRQDIRFWTVPAPSSRM